MGFSSPAIKRCRSSSSSMSGRSSSPTAKFIDETQHYPLNLKKQRIDYRMNQQILDFSSPKFTSSSSSSVISGNENRVSPELNELVESNYYSAWRRRIDIEKSNPSVAKDVSQHGFPKEGVRRRRSCNDDDDDRRECCGASAIMANAYKSVSPSAQSEISLQGSSKLGSGSDGGEKEGGDVFDSKAARVERLKKRFSRIIVKATQLQEKVDISYDLKLDDAVKMQVDKQILMEKKKLKEAQIAAEVERKKELQRKREAAKLDDSVKMQVDGQVLVELKKLKEDQISAEVERKMEIQRKREASRKALLELERSVEVNDNRKTMKDFAMLLGYPRNSAACVCNEIGWYGARVVYWRRTSEEELGFEVLFRERCIRWSKLYKYCEV